MDRWIDGEGVRVSTVKQPQLLRHEAEYAVCWMRGRWERTFASSVFFFFKGRPLQYPQELVTYLCLRWLVAIKYSFKGVRSQSSFGQFSQPGIEGARFRLVRGVN